MGVKLFNRTGRKLLLTEMGIRTLAYAEEIFKKGEELENMLLTGAEPEGKVVHIGVLSTMSRNFIESFIEPLTDKSKLRFSLHSGQQRALLGALGNHQLDFALTNVEVHSSSEQPWQCQLLARQPIAIVGPAESQNSDNSFQSFRNRRWVLPDNESPIRSAFDSFCAQQQFKPDIAAEADDMAMLRLLARDTGALAVIPDIVVKDELSSGKLVHLMTLPNVYENFYAITIKRQFPSAIVGELLKRWIKGLSHY